MKYLSTYIILYVSINTKILKLQYKPAVERYRETFRTLRCIITRFQLIRATRDITITRAAMLFNGFNRFSGFLAA